MRFPLAGLVFTFTRAILMSWILTHTKTEYYQSLVKNQDKLATMEYKEPSGQCHSLLLHL